MTTGLAADTSKESGRGSVNTGLKSLLKRYVQRPLVRELLIVLTFCLFTSALTWPYVTRLRDAVAWVAGILFAFVPYRFNLMAQLVYLFSMWIPLLFEALLLFARKRSWKRAAWLGFVFFMTGLTSISWFLLSLIPLAIWTAVL